jgi:hypothetical protein
MPPQAPTPPAPAPNGRTPASNGAQAATGPTPARLLARLAQVRRDVGRELLAMAETVMAKALDDVGVKVRTRAHRREVSAEVRKAALAAVDTGKPLAPFMAAVGLTEAEALDRAFRTFQPQAEAKLRKAQEKERRILRDGGIDETEEILRDSAAAAGAVYLVQSLRALAREQLTGVPTEQLGEVSGFVPQGLAAKALRVAEGRSTVTVTSPDEPPRLSPAAPPLDALIAGDQAQQQQLTYVWVPSDADHPFSPHHDELDGIVVTGPEDEALTNTQGFPDTEFYVPAYNPWGLEGDHDGCGCALVPEAEAEGSIAGT